MKNTLIIVILISICGVDCYSQIKFENAYFIDNSDKRIDCLIENLDWKNNPVEFEYKLSEVSEPITATIASVKEFGILNTTHKYYRFKVDIDRANDVARNLPKSGRPIFNEEQLFLRPLIEGKATLYVYEDKGIIKYFYKLDNSEVEQLLFKRYQLPENRIGENNQYKSQLWNNLKCEGISLKEAEIILYRKLSLVNFFVKYNQCSNSEFTILEDKEKRDLFNLTIRPGVSSTSLSIKNSASNTRDVDFGSESGFRLGTELEFIMPFKKGKWSLIIEPTYQYFQSNSSYTVVFSSFQSVVTGVTADYKSLEIPFGIRHYFFLNDKSKVFINCSYVSDISFGSIIDFENSSALRPDLDIESSASLVYGLGYNYNNKFGLELRYGSRDILGRFTFWNSDYNTLSLIIGYSIF